MISDDQISQASVVKWERYERKHTNIQINKYTNKEYVNEKYTNQISDDQISGKCCQMGERSDDQTSPDKC